MDRQILFLNPLLYSCTTDKSREAYVAFGAELYQQLCQE